MAKKRKTPSSDSTPTEQPEQPNQTLDQQQQLVEQEDPEIEEDDQEEQDGETEEDESEEDEEEEEQTDTKNDAVSEEPEEEEPIEKLLEPFSKDQLKTLIKQCITQHPDLLPNLHKLADADPSHRKIFVHGLNWDATSETLTSVFSQYGEIKDCKVVKDKSTNKSKGYGFILFKNRTSARKCLKQPQKLIEGRMASCQLASAGPVNNNSSGNSSVVVGPVVVSSTTMPVSEYTQRKIYVSNVAAEIDPNKLLEFFKKFGEVEDGPLGLDKVTGKPRGFCLFVYKSVESAKKALEEPHKSFEGHMLHCQKAVDGPKHSKGGNFNQQQGGSSNSYHHAAKKGRYGGGGGSGGGGGHMMAPSGPGFNPVVAPAAIGQAVAAILASQGAGLGMGNFLGGMNQQGVPPMMGNVGYGGYGVGMPGMQGGYGGQPQMGQGGVRPHQGGAPYMGRGR